VVTNRPNQTKKKVAGTDGSTDEVWYLALRKLHIVQGPGVKPSSIRFYPGQRFALDGDEAVDVEALLRTGAIKIYEDSDEEWAQASLAERPAPRRRRRTNG
jgi:hypothetical protein|tara:strand:- start:508 stop:810 length:303 start_codon:yes stop_codon:yes gene_type:complete